jgi:hypothetical protein
MCADVGKSVSYCRSAACRAASLTLTLSAPLARGAHRQCWSLINFSLERASARSAAAITSPRDGTLVRSGLGRFISCAGGSFPRLGRGFCCFILSSVYR